MARRRGRIGRVEPFSRIDGEMAKYLPLFGIWLIDMALVFGWHRPFSSRRWPDIFENSDFCAMTGMMPVGREDEEDLEEDEDPPPITEELCRRKLENQRKLLNRKKVSPNLPLLKNVRMLADLIGLTKADQAVLTFALGLSLFQQFSSSIAAQSVRATGRTFSTIMSRLTGIDERDLAKSITLEGDLMATGLVKVTNRSCDLEDKVSCLDGIEDIFLGSYRNSAGLMGAFVGKAPSPSLSLDDFPHMQKDRTLLSGFLCNAVAAKTQGVNILVYGKPGVGKNEFVQALGKETGLDLYEVCCTDRDGDPIKGGDRFRVYALCLRLLSKTKNAVLLFDEAEDAFGGNRNFLRLLFGGDEEQSDGTGMGKAWVNRTLENNLVPTIWISNRVRQIDKAYLRRFDYSVSFPTPPHSVRTSIARYHLAQFDPPPGWVEQLAANEEITPAQFERAAKVAAIGSGGDKRYAMDLVEQTLGRSINLLGQTRLSSRNIVRTGYSLEWLNADIPVEALVQGISRRPRGTFCFYGAAGTGKSELARYMADQIGKPLLIKRASDILSKWLGESEQNIAAMFDEARQQDAVLVLDEADSFLGDRRHTQHSWEVTQVNELLTQMETYEGIFICTTNLMTKLDQASLRRFAFKVRFDPLKPDQRVAMFRQELSRLGGEEAEIPVWEQKVRALEQLTPGDFAVAARQFELWGEDATAGRLYDVIRKECEAKGASPRSIGF